MRVGASFTALVVGCAIGVAGSAGSAAAASTETLETSTTLPFEFPADMIVDTQTGHVFVSGGSSSTYIEVLNLAGQVVGQIQHQDGAAGLALSSDGRALYAADSASDSISVINASTLSQTSSYAVGAAPAYVALSGGNLWFTTSGDDLVHEVALPTGVVSTTTASTTLSGARLIASPYAPGVLVSSISSSASTVEVFTVASGTPVFSAGGNLNSLPTVGQCDNLGGMAITPDGKSLDLACGYPYEAFQMPLSTMNSVEQTFNTGPYPSSVAVSGSGETLVGVNGPSVFEFDPGNSTAVGSFGSASGLNVAAFVAWGATDSEFYSISEDDSSDAEFHVFHLGVSPNLSLSVPVAAFPNSTFTVSGRLTDSGSALIGAQVTVTRVAAGVTSTVGTFTTDANGDFSFVGSSPALMTTTTYTASLDGVATALTTSGSITTIPVKYPITPRPVRGPVTAARLR